MPPPSEKGNNWVRVKVNDEYFMLNENISDSSSESGDDNEKPAAVGDSSSSNSSSSSSRSSSGSNSSSDSDDSVGNLLTDKGQAKDGDEQSVGSIASSVLMQEIAKESAASEHAAQSGMDHIRERKQSSGSLGRETPAELVPLREMHNSSANDRSVAARKRSDSITKETPERWRLRLWPSKAITAFCRIITRCHPPESTPGVRLGSGSGSGKNNRRGDKSELLSHWRVNELNKVPTVFNTAADHSSVFFLLTVEECREAVTKAEDPESFASEKAGAGPFNKQGAEGSKNGWIDGEITAIIAESEFAALPKACDPRLGSVWVIAAAIAPTPADAGSNKGGRNKFSNGGELSGGDLVVLHSSSWCHPLLGIIQPWDPDYDIKFGINFSVNQSTYISSQLPSGREGSAQVSAGTQVVNILVCVDQSDGLAQTDIGGWASQGSIVTGVHFSMAIIGNVMTYIRECQALMSLKLINKSLQNMVLTGSFAPNYSSTTGTSAFSAPCNVAGGTKTGNSSRSSSAGHQRERSGSNLSDADSDGPSRSVLSPRQPVLQQPVKCPENVPMPLWLALSRQYNESQLRAICMVSRRFQEKEYLNRNLSGSAGTVVDSSLSLLQGPPGTGKTRTILGIVSVFLAGALNLTAQGTTRIVAGASLYGETAGEASTRWSDQKLSRPRAASISLAANNADGTGSTAKKTRVLICAPSNTAVDEVVYRLITQGVLDSNGKRKTDLSVVRIGQPCRDEYVRAQTVGKDVRQQGISTNDENMVRVVERATLDNLVEEKRRAMMASDTRGQSGVMMKVADIRKQILEQADVVCSTLSGAGSQPMLEVVLRITGFKFDAVIIDEAAQAVEPSSLIPFKYNPQVLVLVGDPCQLPATVFSRTAKRANYNQSLFQRLQVAGYPVLMLETQYRMHPLIAEYPSLRYYQGRLITGSQLITSDSHSMPYHDDPSGRFRPFLFHDVPYSIETFEGTSIYNRDEAQYVVDLFEELVTKYPEHRGGIGIIAPYRAQRRLLNNMFKERFANRGKQSGSRGPPPIWDLDTEISTVDGFQGREKNIVIFSCVRAPTSRGRISAASSSEDLQLISGVKLEDGSEPEVNVPSREESEFEDSNVSSNGTNTPSHRGIGFLKEWQRLNVAITRSRYALWIVGNSQVLRCDSEWRHLIEYSKNKSSFYVALSPVFPPQHGGGSTGNRGPTPPKHHKYPPKQPPQSKQGGYQGKNFNPNHWKQGGGIASEQFGSQAHNKPKHHRGHHQHHSGKRPHPPLPQDSRPADKRFRVEDATVGPFSSRPPPPPGPAGPPQGRPGGQQSALSSAIQQSAAGYQHNASTSGAMNISGPFSAGFDNYARNEDSMRLYLPPSQQEHHPLSPQQRQVQKQQRHEQAKQTGEPRDA